MIHVCLLNLSKAKNMDLSYILNIYGEELPGDVLPVSPPIFQTSNFYYKTVDDFAKAINNQKDNFIYSRGNNPTTDILRKKLAALEGAEDALVFSSGMAAISSAIIANVKKDDHVICIQHPYSWTNTLLTENILPRFGVRVSIVDGTTVESVTEVLQPETAVIYLESPNSWTFEVQDIEAIADIARKRGITTIIDNSYSTPLFQQPISKGVDIVVHTASKYLNGHSDVVAGVCCGSYEMIGKIFNNEYLTLGGILSPVESWLLLRGLRTLDVRMERICASSEKLIEYFRQSDKVQKIYYPQIFEGEQKRIADKQMQKSAGLISIEAKTQDTEAISNFCNSLIYWKMAVSWGGYESLIIPSCIFSGSHLPSNLIRFSVGLESPDSLIKDIDKNINKLK
jgi:cystathionine beta-lyase/cystathionine gamma-synthase